MNIGKWIFVAFVLFTGDGSDIDIAIVTFDDFQTFTVDFDRALCVGRCLFRDQELVAGVEEPRGGAVRTELALDCGSDQVLLELDGLLPLRCRTS